MTDKEFQKLLNKTARAAKKHTSLTQDVTDECLERFGETYSDIDADHIIEILDYGVGGSITVGRFEKEMIRCGAKKKI